ncbi:MAG: hypothetical protein LBS36_12560 [Oscillospiraceae bacterium]|nr:hypothetical protein [Oscillospiraceae bacterium]
MQKAKQILRIVLGLVSVIPTFGLFAPQKRTNLALRGAPAFFCSKGRRSVCAGSTRQSGKRFSPMVEHGQSVNTLKAPLDFIKNCKFCQCGHFRQSKD